MDLVPRKHGKKKLSCYLNIKQHSQGFEWIFNFFSLRLGRTKRMYQHILHDYVSLTG